jgi:NAD(P)-dependent dehydrogenase (short-subunit alcohol dehydrogenase family)
MMMNKIVLITGALSGIGRAVALAFAKAGEVVIVTGRRVEAGEALCQELLESGASGAEFFKVDVRLESDIAALVDHIQVRYGRLDIAINNAGVEGKFTSIDEVTSEVYEEVFSTNVLGLMLSMKHEVAAMKKQGFGSIVNLSSIGGIVGFSGSAVYAASKHAVEGLTKSAALEVAALGIRINSVAPGPIETPMFDRLAEYGLTKQALSDLIPAKRPGKPEEVAQAILFLTSDHASFVVGHSLSVDGGYLAQ